MQAICYHRYSSKRQDRGSSIERQTERTADLCARKGWAIVETIEDRGQSAWKGDHLSVGNLGKLRTRIDAGLIAPGTVLVVENIDRLSRQDYRTARRWIEDVTDRDITVAVYAPELILDRLAMSGANIGAMLQHLLEANRATAEGNRKSSMQKITIEKGLKLAREHLVRVNDVRDLLTAEDDEARFAARLRVRAAFQNLIEGIEFDPLRGLAIVRLVSGLGAMHITSDGRAGYLDLARDGRDYNDVPTAKDFLRRRASVA